MTKITMGFVLSVHQELQYSYHGVYLTFTQLNVRLNVNCNHPEINQVSEMYKKNTSPHDCKQSY